eukprot:357056-Chlamydomonas_euryale.AAC.2
MVWSAMPAPFTSLAGGARRSGAGESRSPRRLGSPRARDGRPAYVRASRVVAGLRVTLSACSCQSVCVWASPYLPPSMHQP